MNGVFFGRRRFCIGFLARMAFLDGVAMPSKVPNCFLHTTDLQGGCFAQPAATNSEILFAVLEACFVSKMNTS